MVGTFVNDVGTFMTCLLVSSFQNPESEHFIYSVEMICTSPVMKELIKQGQGYAKRQSYEVTHGQFYFE